MPFKREGTAEVIVHKHIFLYPSLAGAVAMVTQMFAVIPEAQTPPGPCSLSSSGREGAAFVPFCVQGERQHTACLIYGNEMELGGFLITLQIS